MSLFETTADYFIRLHHAVELSNDVMSVQIVSGWPEWLAVDIVVV